MFATRAGEGESSEASRDGVAGDVVVIFAPNDCRLETSRRGSTRPGGAALKGSICDKPLARNLREAAA